MKHPKFDWWMSVRETVSGKSQRNGDILFGLFKPFRFPKTHRKLKFARYEKKIHKGLKPKGTALSWRLKIDGARAMRYHFTPHYKTVKGILWHHKLFKKARFKKPYPHVVKYGRRHELIIGPRQDRMYRKYGPWGG